MTSCKWVRNGPSNILNSRSLIGSPVDSSHVCVVQLLLISLQAYSSMWPGTLHDKSQALNQAAESQQSVLQTCTRDKGPCKGIASKVKPSVLQQWCFFANHDLHWMYEIIHYLYRCSEASIADAFLLCFLSESSPKQSCDLKTVRSGLAMLASLMEHSAWQTLRDLLVEHPDSNFQPALSQRLIFTADWLFAGLNGQNFNLLRF